MKEIVTLAAVTLLSTGAAAYAGDTVAQGLATLDKASMRVTAPTPALRALDARMTAHKLTAFKQAGQKPVSEQTADAAPAGDPGEEPKAPLPEHAASMHTVETGKNMREAIAWNDKLLSAEGVDVAAYRADAMLASWQPEASPAAVLPGMAKDGADFAEAEPKPMTVSSPFGVPSRSEVAALQAAEGEMAGMGGPVAGADFVAEGWSSFDADADGGLTRLEFGSWVASDAGKDEFAAEANAERDSAEQGTATVRLLNGTSLEFSAADADRNARVSADELTAFIDNA